MLRYCLTWLCTVAISASLLFGLTGCQSSGRPEQHANKVQLTPSDPFLTQAQAQKRRSIIGKVSYDVYLDLTDSEASGYVGRVSIHLTMNPGNKPLLLDFQQGQIHRLLVNGQFLEPEYNNQFLKLPHKHLKTGENIVEVEFTHSYSNGSNHQGLVKFNDPEDGLNYLYTQPGIYATSQILPVFDQPDLKASYKLTVKAPAQWQVISQVRERQAIGGGPERWWYFPETRPISPHAFSVFAGPFKTWKYEQDQLPIRLLVRQSFSDSYSDSLNNEQPPHLLFEAVDQARTFYQQYFEQLYPFFKYDIIALPVDVSGTDLTSANRVLHEHSLLPQHSADLPETLQYLFEHMAHSWLGGSVSPEWWDDQWLWDGLARYLSYLALSETMSQHQSHNRTQSKTRINADISDFSWPMFHTRVKQPAYLYDQLPAAQPLRHDITLNSQAAQSRHFQTNKAAAVVQLLHHKLGDDAFRLALQQFLQQYEDSTTRAKTFFDLIESSFGQSLKHWKKQWLDTTGVPTVTSSYQCKKGQLSSLQIHQTEGRKGSQQVHVGLFRNKQSTLQRYRTLPVAIEGKITKIDLPGQLPCPDFVYPNVDDKGYMQVQLDDLSLKTILKQSFAETLMQTMMDYPIYQQSASIQSTISYATTRLPEENNPYRLKNQLTGLKQLSDQLFRLKSANPAVQTVSNHWLLTLEELAWQQLNIAEPDSPRQNLWFDFFVHIAHTDDSVMHLKRLLNGHWDIDGLQLDTERRWQIIIRLNAFSGKTAKGSWELARREYHNNRSADATRMYRMADAIRPDSLVKNQWLNRLEYLNGEEALDVSRVLLPASQYSLTPALRQSVFAALMNNESGRSPTELDQMIRYLLNECSVNGVQQLQSFSTNKAMSLYRISIETQLRQARQCLDLPKTAVLK